MPASSATQRFKIRPLRQAFSVNLVFARPILQWDKVMGTFLNVLYDSISPKIPIQPNEITSSFGPALSDVWVRYSIYGGASSIRLSSDRITLDFPALSQADIAIALDVVKTAYERFPKLFPEQGIDRIESQTAEHLDLITPGDIDRFLNQFRLDSVESTFRNEAVQTPGLRFGLVSEKEKWQFSLLADRSILSATAIFISRSMTLRPVDVTVPFERLFDLAAGVTLRCYNAIGLELESVPVTT
jgi:hypothetical protein